MAAVLDYAESEFDSESAAGACDEDCLVLEGEELVSWDAGCGCLG